MSPSTPMPKPVQAARLFAALSDPTRLSLLIILRSGPGRSIARLSANAGMTRQAVTKHLRVLEDAGLVTVERLGRETHYRSKPGALDAARRTLDAIAGDWAALRPPPAAG
jgi:DNA-binding transcriptional ArsR family regulator